MKDGATVLMYVPDVEGSSTLIGFDPEPGENGDHTGWLPVQTCGFGLSRSVQGADAVSDEDVEHRGAKMEAQPMTVKRVADFSTAQLLVWLANAEGAERKKEQVLIDYVMPSGRYYLRYELSGVEIVSCSLGFQEPDDATETIVFTYDRIRILQRPVTESGAVDSSQETVAEYVVTEAE